MPEIIHLDGPNLRAEEAEVLVVPRIERTVLERPYPATPSNASNETGVRTERDGVLKARMSGNWVS